MNTIKSLSERAGRTMRTGFLAVCGGLLLASKVLAVTYVYPTDTQATIQAALNSSAEVVFTAGTYGPYSTGFSITSDIKIRGEGDNRTRVLYSGMLNTFPFNNGTLFYCNFSDPTKNLVMEDITLSASGAIPSWGVRTAIALVFPDPVPPSGTQNLQRHTDPGPLLSRVHIDIEQTGTNQWNGNWSCGISLYNAWNTKLSNCYLANPPVGPSTSGTSYFGNAIQITARSINSIIENCTIGHWSRGIYLNSIPSDNGNHEGLFITDCIFVPVWRGVEYSGPSSNSIITLLKMTSCHIDARGDGCGCLLLNPVADLLVSSCNFSVNTANSTNNGWHIKSSMYRSVISGNTMGTWAFAGNLAKGGGITLARENASIWNWISYGTLVSNNVFDGITDPGVVVLKAGTANNRICNNTLINCSAVIDEDAVSDNKVYNND